MLCVDDGVEFEFESINKCYKIGRVSATVWFSPLWMLPLLYGSNQFIYVCTMNMSMPLNHNGNIQWMFDALKF